MIAMVSPAGSPRWMPICNSKLRSITATASAPHVLIDDAESARLLGYYSLSAAQLLLSDLQEPDRKRLPSYPVPSIRMGCWPSQEASKARDTAITCWRTPSRAALGCASSRGCACCWWMQCMKKRPVSIVSMVFAKPRRNRTRCICRWGFHDHCRRQEQKNRPSGLTPQAGQSLE